MTITTKFTDSKKILKEGVKSLCEHMIKSGMDIKPLPHVKIIPDDKNNAYDLLGRTAYYEPSTCTIVLYTLNRHPKDILRSFAHEMIHHIQNLKDKLGRISTTDITEDSNLYELELEAYRDSNLILREWESIIKNQR